MRRYEISDGRWEKIKEKLPFQPGYQGKNTDNRLFVNAVMFVAKCGISWRDLPGTVRQLEYGVFTFLEMGKEGCLTTKIHLSTDRKGKIREMIMTGARGTTGYSNSR